MAQDVFKRILYMDNKLNIFFDKINSIKILDST